MLKSLENPHEREVMVLWRKPGYRTCLWLDYDEANALREVYGLEPLPYPPLRAWKEGGDNR